MQIIPAVDLMNGQCVRLTKGDFTLYKEYSDHPIDAVKGFLDQGAPWIHLVDLDGARSGSPQQTELIAQVLERFPDRIQVGGGIRTAEQVKFLLEKGARRVVLGSVAVREPEALIQWARELGPERFLVAIDLSEGQLATEGWKRVDSSRAIEPLVSEFIENGILNFLSTDISRDGGMLGPNIELYRKYVSRFANAKWTASGGVGQIEDLLALKSIGVEAVIIGKALYEGRFTLEQAIQSVRD